VTAQLAAARSGTQSTRTRAEVNGGGAKPWRQKGTGRARQGSSRAPHWTGGGVALGPKPRSYKQKTPKKMVALALRSALSDRATQGRVAVVESWGIDRARTKDALGLLATLGVHAGKVLVVVAPDDHAATLSFRNLPHVHVLLGAELNAYDVLCADWVVFTSATLPGGLGDTVAASASAAPSAPPAPAAPAAPAEAAPIPPDAAPAEAARTPPDPAPAAADPAAPRDAAADEEAPE
jgi:large subunit ribosomal protein L4